jgi:hypothetical protein
MAHPGSCLGHGPSAAFYWFMLEAGGWHSWLSVLYCCAAWRAGSTELIVVCWHVAIVGSLIRSIMFFTGPSTAGTVDVSGTA